jgi:hypothetical protein
VFMRSFKSWFMVILGLTVLTSHVSAGDISGVVKYKKSRSPASGVKISGLTAGSLGGTTESVRTNDKGKFTLSWKSSGGLAKVYANGKTVAKDVKDGESIVITID